MCRTGTGDTRPSVVQRSFKFWHNGEDGHVRIGTEDSRSVNAETGQSIPESTSFCPVQIGDMPVWVAKAYDNLWSTGH